MEFFDCKISQVFVKLLDGKHRILNFSEPSISVSALKHRIQNLTSVPSHHQLLLFNNSRILHDLQTLILAPSGDNSATVAADSSAQLAQGEDSVGLRFSAAENVVGFDGLSKFPVIVHLLLRLRGGKGGFGSLLRGAATKAGQKKTNNFDACRDMSGRRLRHVNAEKKLEEWRVGAEERKLEKMAEDFLRKKSKEAVKTGKSGGADSAERYVAKYRKDSEKCREAVEQAVRESVKVLQSSKRKGHVEEKEAASKRAKIWLGKRKLGDGDSDSDSEDLDEDGGDHEEEEEENEKSVTIDNGSHSDSSKEAEGSLGFVTSEKLDAGFVDQGSGSSVSEEEEEHVTDKAIKSGREGCYQDFNKSPALESLVEGGHHNDVPEDSQKSHPDDGDNIVSELPGISSSSDAEVAAATTEVLVANPVQEKIVHVIEDLQNSPKPLNFSEYRSASELEVLGLERLKSELLAWGLKCGGNLQERAARLFLLKTTPLEKLPKSSLPRSERPGTNTLFRVPIVRNL